MGRAHPPLLLDAIPAGHGYANPRSRAIRTGHLDTLPTMPAALGEDADPLDRLHGQNHPHSSPGGMRASPIPDQPRARGSLTILPRGRCSDHVHGSVAPAAEQPHAAVASIPRYQTSSPRPYRPG